LIETGQTPIPPIGGLLEARSEKVPGIRTTGFECTVGVENIDEAMRNIQAAGGKLVIAKFQIPTVGSGAYYQDTEGNLFAVMQYEKQ
jgi:predicted enzyme related to lactoylglutathione lyase